jgi:predicted transcriptional regulator
MIFARRSNTLLDEILITDERLDRIAERLDRTDSQLEILADRFDRMVEGQIALQETVSQLAMLWTGLAHQVEGQASQAEADRTLMRQILEYLRNQYPGNGSGSAPTE